MGNYRYRQKSDNTFATLLLHYHFSLVPTIPPKRFDHSLRQSQVVQGLLPTL